MAVEAYLCGRPERALEARRALLALHEAAGDPLAHRRRPALALAPAVVDGPGRGGGGRGRARDRAAGDAPGQPRARDGAERPVAAGDAAERGVEAIALGTRAIELARRLDDRATLAHALTNVGTALRRRAPSTSTGARCSRRRSSSPSRPASDDHAARALVNLTTATLLRRPDDARAGADLERALAFAREHDLDGYEQYLLGVRANLRLLRGAWPAAESDARASLGLGEQFGVSLCPALIVLGRLQSRRGEPEAGATLDDAWRHAVDTGELQRLAPAAAARAEHAWLDGRPRADGRRSPARRTGWPSRAATSWARARARVLALARGRARGPAARRADAVRALDRRRLARRGGAVGRARLPLRGRRRSQRQRRRGRAARRARRRSTGSARWPRPGGCGGGCAPRGVRRIPRGPRPASRAGARRPDAAPARRAAADRRRRDERGDRRAARDLARRPSTTTSPRCWRSSACTRDATSRRPRSASASPEMGCRRPRYGAPLPMLPRAAAHTVARWPPPLPRRSRTSAAS